jgi:amidase
MRLNEYAARDGLELADLVRNGAIAPRELAATALAAMEAVNPKLGAVIEVYEDSLEAASNTRPAGPFAGVPFLVKDIGLHFKGRRIEYGSRLCRGITAQEDSFFGRLVRASGMTLLGRTNTPEFSMALCAENLAFGNTSNPWKLGYSTSGSSGGAGAAVAAGIVPIAHGSDMGGSIRGPAAWCGTVGLFPSRGRVSSGPSLAESGNGMAQSFVLTRSVRDTAVMLDCLGVPQPGDPFVIRQPPRPYAEELNGPPRRLRVAFSAKPLMNAPVDAEIAATVRATAEAIARLGHHVDEAAPNLDLAYLDAACTDVWYYGFDRYLDRLGQLAGRTVGPDTVEKASLAFYHYARNRSVERFFEGLEAFNTIRRRIGPFFQRFDVWITPTCAQVAAPFGTYGMNIDVPPEDFLVHEQRPCQFMIVYNVTGQPAISLPLGMHSSGLPIGVQIGARHGEEHLLVGLAAELEQAMPWRDRTPPVHVALT